MPYDPKRLADYQKRRKEALLPVPEKTYFLHDEIGYSALAAAILYQAIRDLESVRSGSIRYDQQWLATAFGFTPENDLMEYFGSNWFEEQCQMLGISPLEVRKRIQLETPV